MGRENETALSNLVRRQADAMEQLRAQRDELVAALREVLDISDRKHDAWDRARAAIAKVEVR